MYDLERRNMIQTYTTDGVHPNAEGYQVMAKVLYSALTNAGIDI